MMNPDRCKKCNIKCAKIKVNAETLQRLEECYENFITRDSESLLKKYLTREIFDKLKYKKTSLGSSLLDCIQSGFANEDSHVGIYAPDAEAYTIFADIFDPIIEDYHMGFTKEMRHPATVWGDASTFEDLDPAGEHIISTRIRCGRAIAGYPFNPILTQKEYGEIESKMCKVLQGLKDEFKGKYYPLDGMAKETQQQLIDDHFLFKEGDRFLQAANACRHWPLSRGIFHNDNKTFLVWVNEEDHIRIISMQPGGNIGQVYDRLIRGVAAIEEQVEFSRSGRFGFLTFCPTNLGTTIRASVHIKIPKLAANQEGLNSIAEKYNLQVRGTSGEHTEAQEGIYDISNKRRLGLTEYDAVKEMHTGISEIIKLEKSST